MPVVIDTNVFVGAGLGTGAANQVVAACLSGRLQPLIGSALMNEYEDVLGHAALFSRSRLDAQDQGRTWPGADGARAGAARQSSTAAA